MTHPGIRTMPRVCWRCYHYVLPVVHDADGLKCPFCGYVFESDP